MKLNDSIAVQTGAVVSRVLLKQKNGTITLFAFAQGEGLSEHTTPFEAWIYGVEGQAEVRIGEETVQLTAGEIRTLPANVPHAVLATSDFKMLLVMIRG